MTCTAVRESEERMKEKPTVIAVVNQKGGTAKTTTVKNLGIGLAKAGKKVLLIDTDPQASLTICLGYPRPDDLPMTLTDLLSSSINERPVNLSEGTLHQAEGVYVVKAGGHSAKFRKSQYKRSGGLLASATVI